MHRYVQHYDDHYGDEWRPPPDDARLDWGTHRHGHVPCPYTCSCLAGSEGNWLCPQLLSSVP